MTSQGAWRLPAAYRYALELDDHGFAWEFLRRNPEFREEAGKLPPTSSPSKKAGLHRRTPPSRGIGLASPADPPARWGLHFRAEPIAPG